MVPEVDALLENSDSGVDRLRCIVDDLGSEHGAASTNCHAQGSADGGNECKTPQKLHLYCRGLESF